VTAGTGAGEWEGGCVSFVSFAGIDLRSPATPTWLRTGIDQDMTEMGCCRKMVCSGPWNVRNGWKADTSHLVRERPFRLHRSRRRPVGQASTVTPGKRAQPHSSPGYPAVVVTFHLTNPVAILWTRVISSCFWQHGFAQDAAVAASPTNPPIVVGAPE
jgi:hypothetical protein